MAADEYKTCGYAPVAVHVNKETGEKEEKVIYLSGPQPPARRRRNQALRRAESWFKKNNPQLVAEICWGSGRIEDESGRAYVQVSMDVAPKYFALLRERNLDRNALHQAIITSPARPNQQEEY